MSFRMQPDNYHQSQSGFTLLELILYIGTLVIMMSALIPFAWNVIEGGAKNATEREVYSQGRYVSERIKYEIRNAAGINAVSPTQISLATTNPATNPTIIASNSGSITIQQGTGNPIALNSQNTTVQSLNFTNYSSSNGLTNNIEFAFAIAAKYSGAGTRQEYQGVTTIEGDAEVRNAYSIPATPFPTPVANPITLDTFTQNTKTTAGTTLSMTLTAGVHANEILLVGVDVNSTQATTANSTISSITFNGRNMTKISSIVKGYALGEVYYLVLALGDEGSAHTVVITETDGNMVMTAGAATFYNVNTTTPNSSMTYSSANSKTVINSIPSSPGQMVVDVVTQNDEENNAFAGNGQAILWNDTGTTAGFTCGSAIPATASVTNISWSLGLSGTWTDTGFALNQAP